jgi:hypothetical protein
MKTFGFALVGLVLAATPVLAQSSSPDDSPSQSQRMQEVITPPSVTDQADQQQAALTPSGDLGDMLTAIRDSAKIGPQIDALGPLPDSRVEVRDAYAIEQSGGGGNVDQLQQAFNDNRQSVQDLRQALARNKSVDLALSRDQVPLNNVVAANIQPDGKVVVYAYPQDRVPPK